MLMTCTLLSRRNALAEADTHSFVASFPTIGQKLLKGDSTLSISTLCHYYGVYRLSISSIKLGSTRNPACKIAHQASTITKQHSSGRLLWKLPSSPLHPPQH